MQRVVLLTYSKTSDTISFRHYCVSVTPSGLSKGVKALVQRGDVPDLSGFTDLADYVERGGYGSESEGEEAAASRVTLSQSLGRGNLSQRTSRIKLHEVRRPSLCVPASLYVCARGTRPAKGTP